MSLRPLPAGVGSRADISSQLGFASAWYPIDCSAFVSADATGVEIACIATGSYSGNTDALHFEPGPLHGTPTYRATHDDNIEEPSIWSFVAKLDANQEIQFGYGSTHAITPGTDIKAYVIGEYGPEATFLAVRHEERNNNNTAWQTEDMTGLMGGEAGSAIAFIAETADRHNRDTISGIRAKGTTDSDAVILRQKFTRTTGILTLDANDEFEHWTGSNSNVWINGWINDELVINLSHTSETIIADDTWRVYPKTFAGSYALIVATATDALATLGLRPKGSAWTDWVGRISGGNPEFGTLPHNSLGYYRVPLVDGQFEYKASANVDLIGWYGHSTAGYTPGPGPGVRNLKIGASEVDNLRLGASAVDKVYLGSTVVWEP